MSSRASRRSKRIDNATGGKSQDVKDDQEQASCTLNSNSSGTSLRRSQRNISSDELPKPSQSSKKEESEKDVIIENDKKSRVDKNVSEGEGKFMKSESYPRISSRVGARYQAVVPPYEIADKSDKDSSSTGSPCAWSPQAFQSFCKDEVKNGNLDLCEGEDTAEDKRPNKFQVDFGRDILERYLAQSTLMISNFYQNHLPAGGEDGLNNILTEMVCRSNGDIIDELSDDNKSCEDNDRDFEASGEDSSESEGDDELHLLLRRSKKPNAGRKRKRTRRSETKGKHRARRATRGVFKITKRSNASIIDGSFCMVSSCIEDFLLELLHRSCYDPAKALRFLALVTMPFISSDPVGQKRSPNAKKKKRKFGDVNEVKEDDSAGNDLVNVADSENCNGERTTNFTELIEDLGGTLLWMRKFVDCNFFVMTKEEQLMLANTHSKHAYNLSKIIQSIEPDRRHVAIDYSFRFLFVASELMDVELPSMECFRSVSDAYNEESQLDDTSSPTSLRYSPRNSRSVARSSSPMVSSSSSQSLSSLPFTEIVTRTSARLERRQKSKSGDNIYYFPSPNDKGRYPSDMSYTAEGEKDKRSSTSAVEIEKKAFEILIGLREVLDEFSFRQLMNSFALFHEEALSAIDMVIRIRHIFEMFLKMNFPLLSSSREATETAKKYEVNRVGDNFGELVDNGDVIPQDISIDIVDGNVGDTVSSRILEDTAEVYIFKSKRLHNDFLVNFFPLHLTYWRVMK